MLAGDHLKSASDLGLPLVAVGLFYRESYFRQRIDRDGWQHAEYVRSPAELLPAQPALTPAGQPIVIEVPLSRETLRAQVWEIAVGRNKLFLLDTDVDGNSEENRQLAARLYFGDQRIRIRQELLLGVGGVRALRAAGIHWGGLHLNEGHSAFATLEYARLLDGADRAPTSGRARRRSRRARCSRPTRRSTPGHDRFPPELVDDHLEPLRRSLGLAQHEFLGLGRIRPEDHREALCMTVLAFKMSRYANGVSALHGRITRKSWQVLWPHHREDEVPVGHITNGVHVRTWLAPAMQDLYAKYMGADWREHLADPQHVGAHRQRPRRRAVGDAPGAQGGAGALRAPARRRAAPPQRVPRGSGRGGRRRARSRRADHRLRAPVRDLQARQPDLPATSRASSGCSPTPTRPVQLVFAGKAHPADRPGQEVLRQVHEAAVRRRAARTASSSSRTTTSTSAATWSRASTSG